MNKKFLSAILFGALMVTSTGTFVSCKDYDDDIDRIDTELSGIKSQIAALESAVNNGDYVTSVTKTADGKGMTFTFSKGSSVTVSLDVKDGAQGEPGKDAQQVTISAEGELMIDGVGTGIKAGEAEAGKPSIKIEGGNWWLINEDGEYEDTKIPASGLSAVQNDADKSWTLILVDAAGEQQIVEIPSAATMISEIVVASNNVASSVENATAGVSVTTYTFTKPAQWAGPRALVADKSVVYAVSGLDIRVNPVGINVAETPFTLVNTKNVAFPSIKYTATAENGDDPLNLDNINGRAANTGNGLWSLDMQSFVLTEAEAKVFSEALTNADNVAYAVTAGTSTRSLYNVAIVSGSAKDLKTVAVEELSGSDANLAASASTAVSITVDVNKTYTITPVEEEAFYDMYFSVSSLDKETYGIQWDNAARTFIVTKKPDLVTTELSFPLTVVTLDNKGTIQYANYTVNLSSNIDATPDYSPVTYNISDLYNANADHFFNISLETLKTSLGDNYVSWGNNVDLNNTKYYIGEKADGSDKVELDEDSHALATEIVDANGDESTDVNTAKNICVTVNKTTEDNTLKLDKQYYLTVEFYNKAELEPAFINHIVIPITFTAPSVASQFTAKAGYVVDGTINAYFYNTANKSIDLSRYFDAMDVEATLAPKADDAVAKVGNVTYNSKELATVADGVLTLNGESDDEETISVPVDDETNQELGYGKVLTITATNKYYKDSYWEYNDNSKKTSNFTVKVMSPIAEGTITPATGSSIDVIANAENGYDITADMITAKDYTGITTYNIMPDDVAKEDAESNLAWSSAQIQKVEVAKKGGDSNTYIKSVALTPYTPADPTNNVAEKLGTINVKAEPLPNDTPSTIVVTVTDAWGYQTAKDINVTIVTK